MKQLLITLAVISCLCLVGCGDNRPKDEMISNSYCATQLNTSDASEVLGTIKLDDYDILSQSKNVIASLGLSDKNKKMWLKMVAFDQDVLTAKRKYLFSVDEKTLPVFTAFDAPLQARFDCEMIMDRDVLDRPYPSENALKIAVLTQVLENLRADVRELSLDNKMIDICGMMINQSLERLLLRLKESPDQAIMLGYEEGMKFVHPSIRKNGVIKMEICDCLVIIDMRLGDAAKIDMTKKVICTEK